MYFKKILDKEHGTRESSFEKLSDNLQIPQLNNENHTL